MNNKSSIVDKSDVNEVVWVKRDLVKSLILSGLAIAAVVVVYFLSNSTFISLLKMRG